MAGRLGAGGRVAFRLVRRHAVVLGLLGRGGAGLQRRHRWLFALAALMFAGQVALFLFFNPLPSYSEFAQIAHQPRIGLTRLQLLAVFYPVYALLCMGLSLDVVSRALAPPAA